jgi:hypothetical protein
MSAVRPVATSFSASLACLIRLLRVMTVVRLVHLDLQHVLEHRRRQFRLPASSTC